MSSSSLSAGLCLHGTVDGGQDLTLSWGTSVEKVYISMQVNVEMYDCVSL